MSVYGIGKLGTFKDGSKPRATDIDGNNTKEYTLWHDMLRRCYDIKYSEKNPTYKDCTVCDRWLVFANFLEDLPFIENYELWLNNDGYELDKDIKQQGIKNKMYSLDTCKFVSKANNIKARYNAHKRKVMAISLNETKVIVFQSMKQAEKMGFIASNIINCCKGRQKSHKGYTWKYL